MAHRPHSVLLRVTAEGYAPACNDGRVQHAKLPPGVVVGADIAQGRSAVQNAYYWLVLGKIIQHTGDWRTTHDLHDALKMHLNYVDIVQQIGGKRVKVPQSTSFDAMGHKAFGEFMKAAFDTLEQHVLGGMSIDDFMAHAEAA